MLALSEAYEAALAEGVRVDRPEALRLVRLTGPQRVWFLQNTVTRDVEQAGERQWVGSCFLDPKGRVLATFRVGVLPEEIWLDVEPPGAEGLADWFARYRFRTKVEISDVARPAAAVLGPAARDLAGPGEVRATDAGLVFGSELGELGVADVHGQAPEQLPHGPTDLLEVARIEAGVPAFGVDYDSRNLPQEAGLTKLVSVEKGCYVGQETVARIHFRGHINRVVRPLTFDHAVDARGKALLLDGQRVGTVTSFIVSPRRGPIGLGMIRVEPDEGTELDIDGGGRAFLGAVPEGTKVNA